MNTQVDPHQIPLFLIPGSPLLLQDTEHPDHIKMRRELNDCAKKLQQQGIRRLVMMSSQWMSVLGVSLQCRAHVRGQHVDENWHHLGPMHFDLKIDQGFSKKVLAELSKNGFATAAVDYDHFPIDTGTIVASRLLDPQGLMDKVLISCHVYQDHCGMKRLAGSVVKSILDESVPTAVVGVSALTTSYHRQWIDASDDRLGEESDQQWNQKFLALWEQGGGEQWQQHLESMSQGARTDLGLKVLSFLAGAGESLDRSDRSAQVKAYGPLAGSGAAVVVW